MKLEITPKKRLTFFLIADLVIFFFALLLTSLVLHKKIIEIYLLIPPSKVLILWLFKIYRIPWRFFSFRDAFESLKTVPFFLLLDFLITQSWEFTLIDVVFSYFFFFIFRTAKRFYREILTKKNYGRRTIIIGVNNLAEQVLRELLRENYGYEPVGLIADENNKVGTTVQGILVRGTLENLEQVCQELKVKAAIIALPHLKGAQLKKLFEKLKSIGVQEIKIVPKPDKLPDKPVQVKDLKDISLEDLLFREPVRISKDKLHEFFKNKTILVTGAAGSIGSEIVRQLLEFSPKEVIALETDETELHNLLLKLKTDKVKPFLADVRDYEKLKQAFEKWNIDYVFHAAAYKHVPMIEAFPEEAVKTNIFGTYNLARLAVDYGVKKFVNISTDKAVNPTSIMGATKRFAEIICSSFNRLGKTKFISVRFGNVLGSRGSVIPIFLEQIKEGGPVTVTHPEMKRYFMTISEAVSLVLEAAYMGKGGEVFVLDMGQPVKILDLAETLIRLHGLEPYKDIEIKFIGLRPGEKLFEELLTAEEGTDKTEHERIYIARKKEFLEFEELQRILERLKECAKSSDKNCIRSVLEEYITFYKPSS